MAICELIHKSAVYAEDIYLSGYWAISAKRMNAIGDTLLREPQMTKYRHTKPPVETHAVKPDPPRMCAVSGKRMYVNEREARATAANRMADRENGPAQLRTYKCQYCGAWHLSSKE